MKDLRQQLVGALYLFMEDVVDVLYPELLNLNLGYFKCRAKKAGQGSRAYPGLVVEVWGTLRPEGDALFDCVYLIRLDTKGKLTGSVSSTSSLFPSESDLEELYIMPQTLTPEVFAKKVLDDLSDKSGLFLAKFKEYERLQKLDKKKLDD